MNSSLARSLLGRPIGSPQGTPDPGPTNGNFFLHSGFNQLGFASVMRRGIQCIQWSSPASTVQNFMSALEE